MADEQDTTERTRNPHTGYLPALPEGWTYKVLIEGPNDEQVEVYRSDGSEPYVVVTRADGVKRTNRAETLADALRTAGKGVRALVKIAEQEAAIRKARQEGLAALGEPESEEEAVESDEADTSVTVEPGQITEALADKGEPELTWDEDAPHSRACGIRPHDHGTACNANCVSCHGKPNPEAAR